MLENKFLKNEIFVIFLLYLLFELNHDLLQIKLKNYFVLSVTHEKDLVHFSLDENDKNATSNPPLFCEMDELQANLEWKEAARWLKFEEDVDDGGRWSKPHVATLSLHSLLELRSCLTNGAIFLDFQGDDLVTIVGKLLLNKIIMPIK